MRTKQTLWGHIQRAQRLGIAPPVAHTQQPLLGEFCGVEPRAHALNACHPAFYFGAVRGGVGVAGFVCEGGQPVDGHAAGVGGVVQPACPHEALGFA